MSFRVLARQPKVGDEALVMDEIVLVVGIIPTRFGDIGQVVVQRNDGSEWQLSTFEVDIEVIQYDT